MSAEAHREFDRKWRAGEHTCKDGCPTHGRVCCACGMRCRPCEMAAEDGLTPTEQMVAALIWNRTREQYTAAALSHGALDGFEPRTMAREIVDALATRPSVETEALQRVRELAESLEEEATDGSKSWGVLAAYEDAADRLRAALGATQ